MICELSVFSVAVVGSVALLIMAFLYRPLSDDISMEVDGVYSPNDPARQSASLLVVGFLLMGFIIVILLVNSIFLTGGLYRDTISERLSKSLRIQLQSGPLKNNVLIVDGGSYAHRAVDDKKLTDDLMASGYPASVFQVSLAGANHYERAPVLLDLFNELEKVPGIGSKNIIYLREAHSGYDTYPLNQVRTVNERLVGYANPFSSYRQAKSMKGLKGEPPLSDQQKSALKILARATVINMLGTGRLKDAKRERDLKPYAGYRPITQNRKSVSNEVLLKAVSFVDSHVLGPDAATGSPSARAKKKWSWSKTNVSPLLEIKKSHFVDEELSFLPITTNLRDIRYYNSYCRAPESNCLMIDSNYRDALNGFDSNEYWTDPNHLSIVGAKIYTDWLADKLISKGVLEK